MKKLGTFLITNLILLSAVLCQERITSLNDCDEIKYIRQTEKPSFVSMLAGVKNAVIGNKPENDIENQVYYALEKYLKNMGFEKIQYFDEYYVPPKHLGDDIFVGVTFTYDYSYYNVGLGWTSIGTGYTWEMGSNKTAKINMNATQNFYKILIDIYGHAKPVFNPDKRIDFQKWKTCWTENKITEDFKYNGLDNIEGIYETNSSSSGNYRLALKKLKGNYHLIYLSGGSNPGNWNEGEIKAILTPTSTPFLYKAKWITARKQENDSFFVSFENGLMKVISDNNETDLYIKMYPSASDNSTSNSSNLSSGTGFAISSNGIIVTNYHVIDGAKTIKVRGVHSDFKKTNNAKILVSDKNNDLALIQIDDNDFISLGSIPYNVKTGLAGVGEDIFVLGYPLRATMGDEIKLTNGIVSSRTGFQGDITSYQISAPVQPGNSGGPLFDSQGNLIGIINAKHVGAENASYAVKASYLTNLLDLLQSPPKLQTVNSLSGKTLTQQVELVKKFVYIVETE